MATILLADNEPWLRVLARATLGAAHRLLEAWDGQQALDLARRERPHLVLLDLLTPEMDGAAVCRQLKADSATRDITVVALTAPSRADQSAASETTDVDASLTKPFGASTLLELVARVERQGAPSPAPPIPPSADGLPDEVEELDQALVYARDLGALYQAAEARAARFRLLVELGKDLVAARGLDALLRLALERARDFSGYDGGSILLLAAPDGPLEVCASVGADPAQPGTIVQDLPRSVAGQALEVRRPLLLEGVAEDLGTGWREYTKPIPSAVCLPLVTPGGQPLGVLALKNSVQQLTLDADDLDALQLLAAQLAAVVERTRLQERLQRSLDALLALHEAGHVLGSTLQADEIGRRFLDLAGRIARVEAAVISLRRGTQPGAPLRVWQTSGPDRLWRWAQRVLIARDARRGAVTTGEARFFRLRAPPEATQPIVGWCLPLRVQDRVLGVVEVYGGEALAGEATGEILGSLANQAASALENARLYRELGEREQQLQALVGRLLVAQEEERRRVAYDVHDGVAQVAAAAHQHLQAYARFHRPRSAQGRESLDRALDTARRTVGEARRVIADLRPTVLDDFGLAIALRRQVENLRAEGWDITYDDTVGPERLPLALETALFRVAQEALANVRKHAGTTRAHVALRRRGRRVRLEVQDYGRGFRPDLTSEAVGPGERVGVPGMKERVALLGGRCTIRSRPGAGTRVVADVPLPAVAQGGDVHGH